MKSLVLPPDVASPARARRALEQQLERRYPDELVEVAVLLTTELVTNAVVHARTDVAVIVRPEPTRVRVEVEDGSPILPNMDPPTPGILESHGRGLVLVERLADRWGVDRRSGGKTVWFELQCP